MSQLNHPRLEAEGFDNVDWKSTFYSVIPAEAGIQVLCLRPSATALDAFAGMTDFAHQRA